MAMYIWRQQQGWPHVVGVHKTDVSSTFLYNPLLTPGFPARNLKHIQWLKKLPQCLHVFERSIRHEVLTSAGNLVCSCKILWHRGFRMDPGSCDLDQNSLSNKPYKMVTHWGSFLTLSYFLFFWLLWYNVRWVENVGRINNVLGLYLYQFDMLKLVQPSLDLLPPSWKPSLLLSTILLFFSSMNAILSIKSRIQLV